jgi:hypothetical protein
VSSVLGFLHLIFSSSSYQLSDDSPLMSLFDNGQQLLFKDTQYKEKILRNSTRKETKLSLYNSIKGNLSSLELVYTDNEHQRPLESYGLLFADLNIPKGIGELENFTHPILSEIFEDQHLYFDHDLHSYFSIVPMLKTYGCTAGAWSYSHEIQKTCDLFQSVYNAEIIQKNANYAFIKTKVINRNFSNFLWVIIANPQPQKEKIFIDDIGLASSGWLTKDMNKTRNVVQALGYPLTPVFEICIGPRVFDVCFFNDYDMPANELIQVKQ